MSMKRSLRFQLIFSCLLGAALLTARAAEAASCGWPDLQGTCKDACVAGDINFSDLEYKYKDTYYKGATPTDCSGKLCCVPRGVGLCQHISAIDASVPGNLVGNFSCAAKCLNNPLTQFAGVETCEAPNVCCAEPAAAAQAPSSEKAPSAPQIIQLTNPLGAGTTLYDVIRRVISAFLGVVGSLALLVFVYAGILWMTAESSDRVQKAKDTMKYAVVGLAMIAFAYAITAFVVDALTGSIASQSEQQVEYAEQQKLQE